MITINIFNEIQPCPKPYQTNTINNKKDYSPLMNKYFKKSINDIKYYKSQNTKLIKICKVFLRLIDKHFPHQHELYKIFNRITIKESYRSITIIKWIINSDNQNLLKGLQTTSTNTIPLEI